jgi:hypothetical protein
MTMALPDQRHGRHRLAGRLGATGAAVGVGAGLVQVTLGTRIPSWTGDKLAPVQLGLLTVALSLLAAAAATRQNRPDTPVGVRALCSVTLVVSGLLCFSTVGRLWYLPGPLIMAAAVVSLDPARETVALVVRNYLRLLLGLLAAAEALMAVSAPPLLLAVGTTSGVALGVAAWRGSSRKLFPLLVLAGIVPFTALAWTAVVPVVLALLAAAIATVVSHQATHPAAATELAALQSPLRATVPVSAGRRHGI